ncbi:MAG: alpha-amylase family protein [Candidatus Dormiibacterota bacterium]
MSVQGVPEGEGGSAVLEQGHWWAEPFRTFQTNLREIDADLDVHRVVDTVVELGANAWLLNTGGIVSFYPSQLPFQRPSPWLSRRPGGDLIADAITEAHARGIRLISRLDFSKVARDLAEEHPDWCFVDVEGNPQTFNGLYSTCPSAPYYQEQSLEILDEILARYPVDGFFFNWFNFNQRDYSGRDRGICQCVHCRRRFADRCGAKLPVAPDWNDPAYPRWLAYTRETLRDLAGRIRRLIGEHAAGTALILRQDPDVVFQEVNNAVARPQPVWVEWAGEFGRETKGADPDQPALVNTVLFLDLPYRFASEQPGFVALDLAQTIAHGVNPSAYLVGTPERFPKPMLDTVGQVLRFHRDHADCYRGLRSAARVAVVSSPRSQEAYGADGAGRVLQERRGIHRALVEAHTPFDILPEAALQAGDAADRLRRYDVVVLPNVAIIDEPAAANLDAYVQAGGGLVATYETATRDEGGDARDAFALESLGARRVLRRQETPGALTSAYLRVVEPADLPRLVDSPLVPLDRAFLYVEAKTGAASSLHLVPPSRYGPPEKCYWDLETQHSGLLWQTHGSGRTAYLPWPVGALYFDWSVPEHRALVLAAIEGVSRGRPQVLTNAPSCVEVVVSAQPADRRTIVHLINFSGHRGRRFDDPLPVYGIHLDLEPPFPVHGATSLQRGEDLPVANAEGRVTVDLPRLDLFDVLVLEGSPA